MHTIFEDSLLGWMTMNNPWHIHIPWYLDHGTAGVFPFKGDRTTFGSRLFQGCVATCKNMLNNEFKYVIYI